MIPGSRQPQKQLLTLETLFRALADRTRLRIIGLLLSGEVCVCDIYSSLGIPQPKASRHLAYLRRAGLVAARKDGLWVHYRLAELPDPVMQAVVDAVAHALGHLATAERDRRRLALRVELTGAPTIPPSTGRCCSTDGCC
jgi:ArsR family transcriptional regulator